MVQQFILELVPLLAILLGEHVPKLTSQDVLIIYVTVRAFRVNHQLLVEPQQLQLHSREENRLHDVDTVHLFDPIYDVHVSVQFAQAFVHIVV